MSNAPRPLDGVRVLDIATYLAAPFCCTILGEFGAEVIKLEQPGVGDTLRSFGTRVDDSDTLVWLSEARNKKSATLDLRKPQGAALLLELARKADIVVENFRPGTLDKWGVGYARLREVNPRIILVSISAYGQEGPYRMRPGFARIAHAFCGLTYLAGEPGRVPVVPGSTSLADYASGLWAALGAMMALRARDSGRQGQHVDIALYESLFRMLDEMVPAYDRSGFVRERMGADTVNVVPHSHYACRDGRWVAIACTNDKMFSRLATAMKMPALALPERFGPISARIAGRDEVNAIVSEWTGRLVADEVLAVCEEEQVPCSLIYNVADICADPQFKARGSISHIEDPRVGRLAVPSPIPRLSETPARIEELGPTLGQHNDYVYRDLLGLSEQQQRELRDGKVI